MTWIPWWTLSSTISFARRVVVARAAVEVYEVEVEVEAVKVEVTAGEQAGRVPTMGLRTTLKKPLSVSLRGCSREAKIPLPASVRCSWRDARLLRLGERA